MSKTQDFEATLRLFFGEDSARDIVIPVEIRKGSYEQRYELYVDDVHVGWSVKFEGMWDTFICADQNYGMQEHVGHAKTRTASIDNFVYYLAKSARGNVLYPRAIVAYSDNQKWANM